MLGLEPYLKRKPAALSGGQRQRVAMGRAIVREPQAYLMDEPLSNLDAKLRVSMRANLAQLHDRLGTTTVYVTHDQIEAMTLGTRVAVLKDGQLQQVDTPQSLFDRPANLFVATFIGSPSMNLAEAKLVRDDGTAIVFGDHKVPIPAEVIQGHRGLEDYVGRSVIVGVRPSDFEDASFVQEQGLPVIKAEVAISEELGSEVNVIFPVNSRPVQHDVMLAKFDKEAQEADETEALTAQEGQSLWTARVNPKTSARAGRTIELAIDTHALHYFDPESGQAIPATHSSPSTN
jgi:multiple sugar transport system ATP-binding protein